MSECATSSQQADSTTASAPGKRRAGMAMLPAAGAAAKRIAAHALRASTSSKPAPIPPGTTDLGDGGFIDYYPRSLPKAASLFEDVDREVAWASGKIFLFGRHVDQPRQVCYMADRPADNPDAFAYTYSRTRQIPKPWTPAVLAIKAHVEALCGCTFNSCLANKYRTGADSMGWHSDNERVYGDAPTIASVSLGAARDFDLRHTGQAGRKMRAALGSGDVLVMRGATQQHWQHAVPARRGKGVAAGQPRINLTFRTIEHPEPAPAQQKHKGAGS